MNVGFVGMGNMGQMLVAAVARSGVLQPGEIFASNRSKEKLRRTAEAIPGVRITFSNEQLAKECSVLFLCVKPGETKAILAETAPYITPEHLLVAISNTIDIDALEQVSAARVAKVIPSITHAVGEGVSLLIFGERCTAADRALLIRLMEGFSKPIVITESQARVASDLTSCGPAFLSYAFRSLSQAAQKYAPDLPEETADAMVRQTALATLRLIEQCGYTFEQVIDRVSTPGGVTADGINVLDEQMAGVWEQVIETTIQKEELKKTKVEL